MPNPIDSRLKDCYHQNLQTILEMYHHVDAGPASLYKAETIPLSPFLACTAYVRETSHPLAPEHSSHKRGTLLI
jgi:hypothetical protein